MSEEIKTTDAMLLERYKATGMKPAQIEDLIYEFNRFGIDLVNSNPRAANELLSEFAAYRKSGLSAAFLNEIMKTLRDHGIVFHSGDPREQVEKWLERMRWHVKKVDELADENKRLSGLAEKNLQLEEENRRLKCEVVGYRISKSEAIKRQLLRYMDAELGRDVQMFKLHGNNLETAAHKISLDQSIIAVFADSPLNLRQCEALLTVKTTILIRVWAKLHSQLGKDAKPIFSEKDISDAIYAVAADADAEKE